MVDIIGYYVMRNEDGVTMWLDANEKTWTPNFQGSAEFTSAKLADDIAKRQLGEDRTYYVLGCVGLEPGEEN